MKNSTVDLTKNIIGAIAGLGVTLLSAFFTKSIADSSSCNKITKSLMTIGGAVIGGMVAKAANDYISEEVDGVVEIVDCAKTIANTVKENREAEENA